MQERIKDGASIHDRFTDLAFVSPGRIRLSNPSHLTAGSVNPRKQDDRQTIRGTAPIPPDSPTRVPRWPGRALVWNDETGHCTNDQKQGVSDNPQPEQ